MAGAGQGSPLGHLGAQQAAPRRSKPTPRGTSPLSFKSGRGLATAVHADQHLRDRTASWRAQRLSSLDINRALHGGLSWGWGLLRPSRPWLWLGCVWARSRLTGPLGLTRQGRLARRMRPQGRSSADFALALRSFASSRVSSRLLSLAFSHLLSFAHLWRLPAARGGSRPGLSPAFRVSSLSSTCGDCHLLHSSRGAGGGSGRAGRLGRAPRSSYTGSRRFA